jgi:hypothetical protein
VLAIEKLFCQELLRIHRGQVRLLETIPSPTYVFRKQTGVLAFADGPTFETQVLGLETAAKQWMWSWADLDQLDERLTSVRRAISDMFAACAQADDMLTLRAAMEIAGFTVDSDETESIGRRGDDVPMVFERAWLD